MTTNPETMVECHCMTPKLFVVTLILVCAAAASVLYQYVVRIPADARAGQQLPLQQTILEASRRCADDGTRFVSEYMQALNDPAIRYLWDEPEFHFSRKLNTCLVHIRHIRETSVGMVSYQYNKVMDIYGNKPVLYGEFTRDLKVAPSEKTLNTGQADVPNYTSVQYLQEKRKLFSE